MQTFIRKITSRKFLAALAGVATGLASVVSYIMSEGMVDAAAVGAAKDK